MDKQLLLHEAMENELQRLEITKERLETAVKQLPDGSIAMRYNRFYHCYREKDNQYMRAIRDNNFLNELRMRRYIKVLLPKIERRITNCRKFLKNDEIIDVLQLGLQLPEQYSGVKSSELWFPGDTDPLEWADADYEQNPSQMPNPSETSGGRIVRSKSEAIIGTELERAGILHRYEQKMVLFGEVFYPDFIILLPDRRRLVYWEHFGKMDDADYVRKVMHKLEMYSKAGLRLGFDFFITFETKDMPFSFNGAKAKLAEILRLDHIV